MIQRILIVGLGSIGMRHLQLARQLMPKSDIRILRHLPTNRVPEYADALIENIDEAIKFSPQMAIIASPSTYHIKIAQILAEAGVNLFIEKPLAASLIGVHKLLKTCKKSGLVLQLGYNLRFLPSLCRYREFLDEGIVGKILSVRCEVGQYLPLWRPDLDYRKSVSARRDLGGGVLLELSHELDYLRWIFGEVKWVRATLLKQSSLDIDVEDTAHLTLGFAPSEDGYGLVANVNLDFIRHDSVRECVAIGERGSLRWNGLTGEVAVYQHDFASWKTLFHCQSLKNDSYISELRSFMECLAKKTNPSVTGEDGLRVMQIIEAARHSATSNGSAIAVEMDK